MPTAKFKIFGASSHPALSENICRHLGIAQAKSTTLQFSNENLLVRIEEDVRGVNCFVIQTAAANLHTKMMELFIFCDTLRAYGAKSVCAVIPYFPYIRSDKQDKVGVGIVARLVADLLESSGATSAIMLDLHSAQAQGFFRIPTRVLTAHDTLVTELQNYPLENAVLVSPDAGEVKDLIPYTLSLKLPMAIIDKRRSGDDETIKSVGIVGDVKGKTAILIDDEIASGSTICNAAEFLMAHGAKRVWALCTHPVFSGHALERISKSPIERLIVTDTIPLGQKTPCQKIEVLSVAPIIAQAILDTLE